MFQIIVEERKCREVDPTIAMLKACEGELKADARPDAYAQARLSEMVEFFETTTSCYRDLSRLPAGTIRQLARLKSRWKKFMRKPA